MASFSCSKKQIKMEDKLGELLQFVPFASAIDVGFWHKLTQKKLEDFKLDDSARTVRGSYCNSMFYFI